MAKVTIVLEDTPDDTVSLDLKMEGEKDHVTVGSLTLAQIFGLLIESNGPLIMVTAQLRQAHIKNCETCRNDSKPTTH